MGLLATALSVNAATLYVSQTSGNVPPYTNWATAAQVIQDAVDAAVSGDEIVVTNGVYATGGRAVFGTMTNRVAVDKPLVVRSINGPGVTVIQGSQVPGTVNGDGAIRCVYLTSGAMLAGFTLTNGATRTAGDYDQEQTGGGVWCLSTSAVLSNCVLVGNAANNNSGGASLGTLVNCTLRNNTVRASGSFGGGASGSVLSGCTLTGNSAVYGGGVCSSTLTNCLLSGNSAGYGGGAYDCTLSHCGLSGNSATSLGGGVYEATLVECSVYGNSAGWEGGGAYRGTLSQCTLDNNRALSGGGAYFAALLDCALTRNRATQEGGGVYGGTLTHCVLTTNSVSGERGLGGGARSATLNNCVLRGNSAYGYDYSFGGGASECTLSNCALIDNLAENGGGAHHGWLVNCTLTGNSATAKGGGVYGAWLGNCIAYFNTAQEGPNWYGGALEFCCATPVPEGRGNIGSDPELAAAFYLSAGSPCRGAGTPVAGGGRDIDGEPWGSPPSIGCDEFNTPSSTGPLAVRVNPSSGTAPTGLSVNFAGSIEGHPVASVWHFGDGLSTSNRPFVRHSWEVPGDYVVTLTAYNSSNPAGVTATARVHVVVQPVHYVAAGNPTPAAPYSSWSTAATNLQDAVDAVTLDGSLVLVSNGVYRAGGRVQGGLTNRVAVTRRVTLRSVNGPAVTLIEGFQMPGTTNGNEAVRCVYLGSGATLAGFTLTNGATRISSDDRNPSGSGGGICCQSVDSVVTHCVISGNAASYSGGGVYRGTVIDCVLTGNTVTASYGYGGGAMAATLSGCTLNGNSAGNNGGGVYVSTLDGCTLTANSAFAGGGASESTLDRCMLSGNSATLGGGVCESTLRNCTLTGNRAAEGGGAWNSSLRSCALSANSANTGGAAACGELNNCTVVGNSATTSGGGTAPAILTIPGGPVPCVLNNCIVYFNRAPVDPDYSNSRLNYCCTSQQPADGAGNITLDPLLASDSHLSPGSPCLGAGSPAYASGTDIDGEAWTSAPAIGCDEFRPGSATGPLTVTILPLYTNAAVGYTLDFQALIGGRPTRSEWDFGDGTIVGNRPFVSHAWSRVGDYRVELRVYNETFPQGRVASLTVHIQKGMFYVRAQNATPQPPYTTWASAATVIQDAVDAACVGGTVLVSNGVYATGGRAVAGLMTNRVAVIKPLRVRSVGGPDVTTILGLRVPGTTNGDGAVRCVYLCRGASLSGFTLAAGATRMAGNYATEQCGGGLWCESSQATVSDCVLTGNSAFLYGGGACSGTLQRCVLSGNTAIYGAGAYEAILEASAMSGNRAQWSGGGAYACTLNHSAVQGNSATYGGGAYLGTVNHCLITDNSALYGGGVFGVLGEELLEPYAPIILNNCVLTGNLAAYGGAAFFGILDHCTVAGNFATNQGGGVYAGMLTNCIIYYNTAANDANYATDSWYPFQLSWCCTTPLSSAGPGNLTNEPAFVNFAAGDLHLAPGSPCIDSGTDLSAFIADDFEGTVRPADGNSDGLAAFDIGAYEFLPPDLRLLQALQKLIALVNQSGLAHAKPLTATLEAALASFKRGDSGSAANQLAAFQNKVQAQVAPSDPALAAGFVQLAQEIVNDLGGKAH